MRSKKYASAYGNFDNKYTRQIKKLNSFLHFQYTTNAKYIILLTQFIYKNHFVINNHARCNILIMKKKHHHRIKENT